MRSVHTYGCFPLSSRRNGRSCCNGCKHSPKPVFLSVVLSLGTVSLNPITWLPILATSLFTWVIDSEDIIKFKNVMILTVCMWFVYDAYHLNFVSAAFDAFTVVSTGYSVWQIKKERKAGEN